ncbi:MAG: class IV adenylate cyclase [Planctomycetia bacterium]|nr:class IV adenylate cyclase [Planctomycetia bacterium]
MLEVEVKFRVRRPQEYQARIEREFHAQWSAPTVERDLFFVNELQGFPSQGKALRIRQRDDVYLAATYKGPKLDALTKTREEIELPLTPTPSSPEETSKKRQDWILFFERLGFQRNVEVVKTRQHARFQWDALTIEATLDSLESLGYFTELEAICEQSELEQTRQAVLKLAEKLHLAEPITQSYLALQLAAQTGRDVEEK